MHVSKFAHNLQAILTVGGVFCSNIVAARAAEESPAGMWRIIDDQTGQAQGIMKIYETKGGTVAGRLERTFIKADESKVCAKCSDDRKNKPFVGLELIRGLRKDGGEYVGGTILDPNSGTEYSCTVKVVDGGQKLLLRGYVGISLLGRTQTWLREK